MRGPSWFSRLAAPGLLAILLLGATSAIRAADPAPAAAGAPPPAVAPAPSAASRPVQKPDAAKAPSSLEKIVADRVRARVGGEVGEVRRMPFGLWEAAVDGEIIYVDEGVHYLIAGRAFDLTTRADLTTPRKDEINKVAFDKLPLSLAVKVVRGDGSRRLAVFEDPNCPYCKRFEHDISTLNNVTIFTFLYPILSDDSFAKSRAVWCSPDRAVAWTQLMREGKPLEASAESCQDPLQQVLALGQKLKVTGTPTLVFPDGRRAPGAIPIERVEQMLAEAAGAAVPRK